MPPYTFSGMKNLKSINLAPSVVLDEGAFLNCDSLKSVSSAISEIGKEAFKNTSSLSMINVLECNSVSSKAFEESGIMFLGPFKEGAKIEKEAFVNIPNLKSLRFGKPSELSNEGSEYYVDKCVSLEEVYIDYDENLILPNFLLGPDLQNLRRLNLMNSKNIILKSPQTLPQPNEIKSFYGYDFKILVPSEDLKNQYINNEDWKPYEEFFDVVSETILITEKDTRDSEGNEAFNLPISISHQEGTYLINLFGNSRPPVPVPKGSYINNGNFHDKSDNNGWNLTNTKYRNYKNEVAIYQQGGLYTTLNPILKEEDFPVTFVIKCSFDPDCNWYSTYYKTFYSFDELLGHFSINAIEEYHNITNNFIVNYDFIKESENISFNLTYQVGQMTNFFVNGVYLIKGKYGMPEDIPQDIGDFKEDGSVEYIPVITDYYPVNYVPYADLQHEHMERWVLPSPYVSYNHNSNEIIIQSPSDGPIGVPIQCNIYKYLSLKPDFPLTFRVIVRKENGQKVDFLQSIESFNDFNNIKYNDNDLSFSCNYTNDDFVFLVGTKKASSKFYIQNIIFIEGEYSLSNWPEVIYDFNYDNSEFIIPNYIVKNNYIPYGNFLDINEVFYNNFELNNFTSIQDSGIIRMVAYNTTSTPDVTRNVATLKTSIVDKYKQTLQDELPFSLIINYKADSQYTLTTTYIKNCNSLNDLIGTQTIAKLSPKYSLVLECDSNLNLTLNLNSLDIGTKA